MQFRRFEQHFRDHQLISVQEIRNAFSDYDRRQLSQWEDKGWIIRLRQGQYLLNSRRENLDKELLANEIKNSYISLEYALNYHNFIPEVPHKITSITTERSETVTTPVGDFIYRRIKPGLFTGYNLVAAQIPNRQIKLGSPTKSLFDWIYLHDRNVEDLRLNTATLEESFSRDDFLAWQEKVAHPAIQKRLTDFLETINDA